MSFPSGVNAPPGANGSPGEIIGVFAPVRDPGAFGSPGEIVDGSASVGVPGGACSGVFGGATSAGAPVVSMVNPVFNVHKAPSASQSHQFLSVVSKYHFTWPNFFLSDALL